MTTENNDFECGLFNASDDWILHYVDDTVFDETLLLNILFQDGILMHESYLFNSSLLARHVNRNKAGLSLFEYAAKSGLIIPAVRNKSETLRESYSFLHDGKFYNSFDLLIPELKPYKNRIIGAVDCGLKTEQMKPKWWPEPNSPDKVLGNQYLKLIRKTFQQDVPPLTDEENLDRKLLFQRVWERSKSRRFDSIEKAAEMTKSNGSLGIQRMELIRHLGWEVGIPNNNTTRHRSCPRCQGARTHEWLENVHRRLLPRDHDHVVFTLPHERNALWQYNRSWCSDHLFQASAETLKQLLADDKYLGAEVGLLSALPTWGRTLSVHPHVPMLVSGGGLKSGEFKPVKQDFLLPVGVIKAKFRGKWLAWLNEAHEAGALVLPPDWTPQRWLALLRKLARKDWNVRIPGGYRHGNAVVIYLSRYMRGSPIKDYRIVAANHETVIFRYRDHRDRVEKHRELSPERFIARVLSHVPVKGQHNVRYYGRYTAGAVEKCRRVRDWLGVAEESAPTPTEPPTRQCPDCGRPLFHRAGVRRRISSHKNTQPIDAGSSVQQVAQADPTDLGANRLKPRSFLGRAGGCLAPR